MIYYGNRFTIFMIFAIQLIWIIPICILFYSNLKSVFWGRSYKEICHPQYFVSKIIVDDKDYVVCVDWQGTGSITTKSFTIKEAE